MTNSLKAIWNNILSMLSFFSRMVSINWLKWCMYNASLSAIFILNFRTQHSLRPLIHSKKMLTPCTPSSVNRAKCNCRLNILLQVPSLAPNSVEICVVVGRREKNPFSVVVMFTNCGFKHIDWLKLIEIGFRWMTKQHCMYSTDKTQPEYLLTLGPLDKTRSKPRVNPKVNPGFSRCSGSVLYVFLGK